MRGDAASMRVLRPSTIEQALDAYARHKDAVPFAGGTDFMVGWNAGGENGRVILDLGAMTSWRRVRESGGGLRIGALATHWQLQHDPRVAKRFPLLVDACATIGGRQIQTRGTLGGNIANASPAGDTFPALAVYDARVRVLSTAGRRTLPIVDVFAGVKKTVLGPGELIEAIDIDYPKPPARELFRKVGTRAASAISKTVAAGLLWLRKDGTIRELRFALGSMAPTVRRLRTVETFVAGKKTTKDVVEEAVALLEKDVSPIDDLRSTRFYRLEVSKNILRGFLQ